MFRHKGLYFRDVDPLAIGKMDFIATVMNPGCWKQRSRFFQDIGQEGLGILSAGVKGEIRAFLVAAAGILRIGPVGG